jgi:5-methylcytosine-specific restriction endonuclease McrA
VGQIMAKGLCPRCYRRLWSRKKSGGASRQEYFERLAKEKELRSFGVCVTCGKEKKACYKKTIGKIIICKRCGKERKHEGLGLCAPCYVNTVTQKRKTKKVICAICGKLKIFKAKGLCQSCYTKYHKKTWSKKLIICSGCQREAEHEANGLCWRCYFQSVNGRKYNQIKAARRKNLPATLTDAEWIEILEKYNYACAYCKESDKPLHQEHWIPLSRGGGYTAGNIVPSCKRCNSRKHTMTGDEFLEMLKKEKEYAR